MRVILVVLMCIWPAFAFAQVEDAEPARPRGFFFGAAAGGGLLKLTGSGVEAGQQVAPSFPNLKIGFMLSDQLAVAVLLPGTIYKYQGVGEQDRPRDRGFEGVIPSVQYWAGDRWWFIGGAGLTLDAPTFYDVRGPSEGRYYFGPSISLGAGYEVWRKGRFSADIQSRLQLGSAQIAEGDTRRGVALNLLIGFNAD